MKKIGATLVFLILGMFSGNVVGIPTCNEHCQDLGFSGGACYVDQCPAGTTGPYGGYSTGYCYCETPICCCDGSTTSTTEPASTTTTTIPTTTTTEPTTITTIPGAMEFGSLGIVIAVLLTTPAFAYLIVRRKGA